MDDKLVKKDEEKAGGASSYRDTTANKGRWLAPNVMKCLYAPISTWVMNAACKLAIFDILHENGPGMTAGALAGKMGASEIHLTRLMNACVKLEFLKAQNGENGKIIYSNTEESAMYLRKKSKISLVPAIDWHNFFVKKTEPLFDEVIMQGCPLLKLKDWFGVTSEDPALSMRFDQAMESLCRPLQDFPHLFDFSRFRTLIDCGGGLGTHAKYMKEAYPAMIVSVLETDQFINRMKKQGFPLENQYLSYISEIVSAPKDTPKAEMERVCTNRGSGDFFHDLPEADLYLLSHVIHNWPDEKYDIILNNVYKALPSGGGLILLEKLYNENKDCTVDLAMDIIMMTISKGRERTRDEHKMMLEKHGFGDIKIWAQIPLSPFDVIFALKP